MPTKKAKKVSGPSGQHTKPGVLVRAEPYEIEAWKLAAASGMLPMRLTNWIRSHLNFEAAKAGHHPSDVADRKRRAKR